MSHIICGVIGSPELLRGLVERHPHLVLVTLGGGVAMLPVRDDDLDAFLALPLTGSTAGFTYLSDQLRDVLVEASAHGPVMYVETGYFGGVGTQGAIVVRHGETIYGPRSAERGPINEGLALLGVRVVPPARDEFDTVGLGRHRSTSDWLGLSDDAG